MRRRTADNMHPDHHPLDDPEANNHKFYYMYSNPNASSSSSCSVYMLGNVIFIGIVVVIIIVILHYSVADVVVISRSVSSENNDKVSLVKQKFSFTKSFMIGADNFWSDMLVEGRAVYNHNNNYDKNYYYNNGKSKRPVAIEVGMHRPNQCIEAAEMGFEAHCLEPSPDSFRICKHMIDALPAAAVPVDNEHSNNNINSNNKKHIIISDLIHLHNIAASDLDGVVSFNAGGSTGDHVGNIDVWNMKKIEAPVIVENAEGEAIAIAEDKKGEGEGGNGNVVLVQSSQLDHVISKHIDKLYTGSEAIPVDIWIAKIDTQGFEPKVFAGLSENIKKARIKIITFEYWPKGMDLMVGAEGDGFERCKVSLQFLNELVLAGYKLFPMTVRAHPRAGVSNREINDETKANRPLNDFWSHCEWYYELDETVVKREDYHMGYWTDIVAFAPDFSMISTPTTRAGKAVLELFSS